MNRVDFIKIINYDDIVSVATKYFEENSLLYECINGPIQHHDSIEIKKNTCDKENKITFDIYFQSVEIAKESLKNLTLDEHKEMELYEVRFSVYSQLDVNNNCHLIVELRRL